MAFPVSLTVAICAVQGLFANAVQLRQSEQANPITKYFSKLYASIETKFDTRTMKQVLYDEVLYAKHDHAQRHSTSDCSRDWNCGVLSGEAQPPLKVPCKDGERWMSPNAVYVPGKNKHNGLVYCSIPKIGTTFTFWVLEELKLQTFPGKRNAGYRDLGSIVWSNDTEAIDQVCDATSFIITRNPYDRVVSGYVDKVLSNRFFKKPPSFDKFLKELAKANATQLNPHFRPASLHCSTTGEHAARYDKVIHIEANMEKHLGDLLINGLSLPGKNVHKAITKAMNVGAHHSMAGNKAIDESVKSHLGRTDFYFKNAKKELVQKIYGDDIEFGHYAYGGMKHR